MENSQMVSISWPFFTLLLLAFMAFGIWIGKTQGEKQGIKKGKAKMWWAIEARLLKIREIIYCKAGGKKINIQGVLEVRPPEPVDIEDGLPYGIRFIPDAKQREPDDH